MCCAELNKEHFCPLCDKQLRQVEQLDEEIDYICSSCGYSLARNAIENKDYFCPLCDKHLIKIDMGKDFIEYRCDPCVYSLEWQITRGYFWHRMESVYIDGYEIGNINRAIPRDSCEKYAYIVTPDNVLEEIRLEYPVQLKGMTKEKIKIYITLS